MGLLQFCLDHARSGENVGGVFEAIRDAFGDDAKTALLETVSKIADFRNKFVAHQEAELTDSKIAEEGLKSWVAGLWRLYQAHT